MKFFKLPDLGEGLAEAEIVSWAVRVGQEVTENDVLLSVETAKAVVDIPSPVAGVIKKCFGHPGDVIDIGDVLVEFDHEEDQGSVVGQITTKQQTITDEFVVGAIGASDAITSVQMTPQARLLANRLGVDQAIFKTHGSQKVCTEQDVIQVYLKQGEGRELLSGSRKNMAQWIESTQAKAVVAASIVDDVTFYQPLDSKDLTAKALQAMALACQEEPALNAWFDGQSLTRQLHRDVHIGLAVDSEHGLYVPVIKHVAQKSFEQLQEDIEQAALLVHKRQLPPERLTGATITLSNFGTIAGRYATPIITVPQVAILGVGRLFQRVQLVSGKVQNVDVLPASLTFDHRACTGGESARFLRVFASRMVEN